MQCQTCGATEGHTFECAFRPKGTAPVVQVDWRIIEVLIAVYSKHGSTAAVATNQ